jgi:hypothetical protein
MTPHQFQRVEREQNAIIAAAHRTVYEARELVDPVPPRKQLRHALAEDIREGVIVWHDNGDDGWFWNIVCEPRHHGDAFKAYVADDGCRYGLDGAWVYKDAFPTNTQQNGLPG